MKTQYLFLNRIAGRLLAALLSASTVGALAQGTINFDARPYFSGRDYYELGMHFGLIVPSGSDYDGMTITSGGGNTPTDGTPFMAWFRQFNPNNFVSLSLTNGSPFGLASVQLADPTAPSFSPVTISFVGTTSFGSSVTNTFTTPGNGATQFANYTFAPSFASGLTKVDIFAPRWAIDSLVFTVPEPSSAALAFLAAGAAMFRRHWKCNNR